MVKIEPNLEQNAIIPDNFPLMLDSKVSYFHKTTIESPIDKLKPKITEIDIY